MAASFLTGVTVLDLASVGPAARTSRWLADYGARVVKIGPPPRQSGVQIVPPFYAYSGHRGMQRVLLDLKQPSGRDAFLKLARSADVVIESFRPGVVDRLGIGAVAVREVNPGIVYCSTSGYGQSGPRAQWAGHDLNYLALGGYLDCSGRNEEGGPALPGATVGDAAGGGMQAVIAILAALVHRAATGEGATLDVSVADGVVALMSLYIDEYLATGEVPGPGHNILTGRYACYDVYRCADDRWIAVGAIEPHFFANLCRALGCEQWLEHQTDDAVQDAVRADFRPRSRRARVTIGSPSSGRPTRACRRSRPFPSSLPQPIFVNGRCSPARPLRGTTASSRSGGCSRAWTAPSPRRSCVTRPSPTPTHCWARSATRLRRSRRCERKV